MSFFRDWENSVHYRLPQEWNRANFSNISRNFAMTYAFFEGGSTDNDLHQSTKLLALSHYCWGSEVDKTPSSSSSSPSKFAICYSHFRCRFTTLGYPLSAPYLPQHFTPSTIFWAKWPSFGLILSLLRACACLWLFGKAFSISYKTTVFMLSLQVNGKLGSQFIYLQFAFFMWLVHWRVKTWKTTPRPASSTFCSGCASFACRFSR